MRHLMLLCACFAIHVFINPAVAQLQKIYVNPRATGAEKQSDIFEITGYIPLEGYHDKIDGYSYLIVTPGYFIFYEFSIKRLSFFTREGKFVKKILLKKFGEPRIEYDDTEDVLKFNIQNKNYILTTKDLADIKMNYAKKSTRKYFKNYIIDLKDTGLQIKQTPIDPYLIIGADRHYNNYYLISDPTAKSSVKDSTGYEFQLLQNHIPVKSFFPFNKAKDARFKNYPYPVKMSFSGTDTPYIKYTARIYEPVIYKLVKDSIFPLYEIVLPLEYALPPAFYKTIKTASEWESFRINNGNKFSNIAEVRDMGKYLFFSLSYMQQFESYLYNKEKQKVYNTKFIKADSTQLNITLLSHGNPKLMNGYFYVITPADALFNFYNKNKSIAYSKELEAFFKNGSANSNPVIIQFKFRETL